MSLFSLYVPHEYFNVTHDVMRMACIQVVVQFLFSVVNADENPFFSVMFLQTIAFVVLGVVFYWLVLRYVVRVHTDASATPDDAYSPATHAPPATNETYEGKHHPQPVRATTTSNEHTYDEDEPDQPADQPADQAVQPVQAVPDTDTKRGGTTVSA